MRIDHPIVVLVARAQALLQRGSARAEREAFEAGYRCGHRAGLRQGRLAGEEA